MSFFLQWPGLWGLSLEKWAQPRPGFGLDCRMCRVRSTPADSWDTTPRTLHSHVRYKEIEARTYFGRHNIGPVTTSKGCRHFSKRSVHEVASSQYAPTIWRQLPYEKTHLPRTLPQASF